MILYVATSNPGKLRDFAVAAKESGVVIKPLPGLRDIPAPPEREMTFAGNARAKAVYYSRFAPKDEPGQLVLSDDSGLEVDALHGQPGVHSARYAADAGYESGAAISTDQRNNLYLLRNLTGVAAGNRKARYRCILVAARDGACLYTGEGSVEGEILTEPRGQGGFGYDPLFYLPELKKTMAQIDLATKHTLSHRGKALRALLECISQK